MNVYTTETSGDAMVTKYCNDHLIHIIFLNTGYETITDKHTLENGKLSDPYTPSVYGKGYIGVGPYKSNIGGQMTKPYACWRHMIGSKIVCDEWLNYQNFAAWYFDNHEDGHRLRCDAKLYSPSTAKFVQHADSTKKKTYKGCYWKQSIGKWRAYDGLRVIGDYDTPEEAENAFMQEVKPRE